MVYEVLVPQPGIEPSPPALEAQGPNHWTASCSVALSCPTLCDPLDCSTPGFPVLHCLLESKLMSWVGKIPWRRKRLPTPVFWPRSQRIRHDWANFTFTFSLSGPLSRWCRPTISSSAVPFSSCFQSSPASGPGRSPKTVYLTHIDTQSSAPRTEVSSRCFFSGPPSRASFGVPYSSVHIPSSSPWVMEAGSGSCHGNQCSRELQNDFWN